MCGFMALYKFDFNFNFNLNATRSGTYSKASVLQVGLPSRAQSVASNTNPVSHNLYGPHNGRVQL